MKYPFSDPRMKIQRARKHLAELEVEAAAFIASNPIKLETVVTEKAGRRIISFATHIRGVPAMMGAIVGDIIHNLRTALDLTVCEVVRAAGRSDKDVYFPFAKSEEEIDAMIKSRNLDRAGSEAVALVRSLKPYHNGNAPLRLIHDLDVQDKHRALIPQVMSFASPTIRMWEDDGSANPRVIGDPTEVKEIKLKFPRDIGVPDAELIPTLHELVGLVEGVVEAFCALANAGAGETRDNP